MGSQLPILVQYIQALGPTFIAVIAGAIASMIAWRQWKTAHQRGVLDLFERRMAVYQDLRSVISSIVTSGHSTTETFLEFTWAADKVSVLFGPEVQAYIANLRHDLNIHVTQCTMIDKLGGEARATAIRVQSEKFERLAAFYDEFPKLIAPYVEMHQKIP